MTSFQVKGPDNPNVNSPNVFEIKAFIYVICQQLDADSIRNELACTDTSLFANINLILELNAGIK